MKESLNNRFISFLKSLNGFECIDNLTLTDEQKSEDKADFFAENRRIIIELKSLEEDTQKKIDIFLEPHKQRQEYPRYEGKKELGEILSFLPDGEKLNFKIFDKVISPIEGGFRQANKQIRTIKKTFNLPNSQGLLIFFNEKIEFLEPAITRAAIFKTMGKTTLEGDLQFQEINHVLLLSDAHKIVDSKQKRNEIPLLDFLNPFISNPISNDFIDLLWSRWAKYNDVDLAEVREINATNPLDEFTIPNRNS